MSETETAQGTRDRAGRVVVRRHAEVVAAAQDPVLFSSAASAHLQVPNGLDGAEHARARRLLDPFFAPDELAWLAPVLDDLAAGLVDDVAGGPFDAVELGARYAVRAQSAWLGWPADLEAELLDWVAENRAATRSGDRAWTGRVAARFDRIVRGLLDARRAGATVGPAPTGPERDPATGPDVTARLLAQHDDGRPAWTDEELVSILRNWTGGDLSSLALCAGVVVHWLTEHPEHQRHLRDAPDAALDAAVDEILRLDDPFVSNRRVATRDTVVAGCPVAAGEQVVLDWRAANRDPEAFDDPAAYDPEGHADRNLVYGTGPHVCPGRPLATLELRVLVRRLLRAGTVVHDDARPAERETAPVAGFRTVPVRVVAAR
ncbi:cytochrome P450 [Cellulosimicrobium cellulans]|uniref:cytochrome P450 n=1 Tax=Cellulosimicrobium cellulans TaxID=1710 RepID=UPI002097047D|nr:cytochrome P450 [Cellulosimicrobium cellulans]MCO7273822.1 cytochrome P450 [Cellulosimicrobium cellulans]